MGKTAQVGVVSRSSAHNKSLMDLHVHDLPATPLHGLPCQGDWQNTNSEGDWTDCDATHRSTCVSPEPQTSTSHEHLPDLLSKMDALPQLQTIQWIPRGLEVRLQALDRAMQAAKANTAAPIQRLRSKMALITPHLILRVAPGRKQQEEGVGSIRDEFRKQLVLAEKDVARQSC